MAPHIFGIFPYGFAWYPIIDSFLQQLDDLCDDLKSLMPDWVPLIIVGCFSIFSCFTFVQWRRGASAAVGGGGLRTDALPTPQVPMDATDALLAHGGLVLLAFGARLLPERHSVAAC